MNMNVKKEKISLSELLNRYFVQSKHATLNMLIFTVICVIISRLIMFVIYAIWFSGRYSGFFDAISAAWDCGWYKSIINYGYPLEPSGHENGDAASWAFFPLSPMIIRFFASLLKISPLVAGFFVNTLFFILAMLISYKYIMLTRNNVKLAVIFILYMSFGPNNFYYSSLYTESLFMLLTVWFLYELTKERYLLMGVSGALLSATRVTGVFIVFSVLIYLIYKHLREKQGKFLDFIKNIFSNPKLLLGVCIVPVGLFAYMLYLHLHVGDALAFTHIQKAWGRSTSDLFDAIKVFFRSGASLSIGSTSAEASLRPLTAAISTNISNALVSIYYTVIFIIIILVTVYTVKKRRAHESVPYVFPCAINVLTLGFVNISRYSSGTGIFILNLIDVIETKLPKPAKIAIYSVFIISSLVLQYMWFDVHFITIG